MDGRDDRDGADDELETAPLATPVTPAPLALRAAAVATPPPRSPRPLPVLPPDVPVTLTTAVEAMRTEEIARTRQFIVVGWAVSIIAALTIWLVGVPSLLARIFVGGLALGIVYSAFAYRRFADPARYTERELLVLAVICVINSHVGVMIFGAYSAAAIMVVIGIHFLGRTELVRVARVIYVSATLCYAAIGTLMIAGITDDPGVFAADTPLPRATLVAATLFVLGAYALAYFSAGTFRRASLAAIEELQRATRLASQREALMEELRADLEHALAVGGPGRYTGQRVGRYELGIVLGRGAIGEVYEAADANGGAAAVKLLRREQLADPTQVARFAREIRAAMAIDSPHVVRVLDAATEADPMPYFAMERLYGTTLGELLRREPRLAVDATRELVRQAADGVDASARAGVVHRDLKPQNLLRTTEGVWKILDFGVARTTDTTGTLTHGDAIGTPHYMSPEQGRGGPVDHRSDLYALAAIAYRCLTGRYPFTATDTPALLYAVIHRAPTRPGALAALPDDVDRWFAIALAKQPDDRFSSGSVFATTFTSALAAELDVATRKRADTLIRRQPWEGA